MARQDGVARYDHNLKENRYPRKIPCRLNRAFYNSAACNPNKGEFMKQAAQAAQPANDEQTGTSARPVKSIRQGGVKVDVWRNTKQQGADLYDTTISNSYKDDASGNGRTPRVSAQQVSRFYPSFQAKHFRRLAS
jgi:hypothetical protein